MFSESNILSSARNYIDGLLLSDAYINTSVRNCNLGQLCSKIGWLNKIKKDFTNYNIECSIYERKNIYKKTFSKKIQYMIQTRNYIEFDKIKRLWYQLDDEYIDNKGKIHKFYVKIVPRDIKFTQECVANWYLGDGSCVRRIKNSKLDGNTIELATMGFIKEDVDFLSNSLNYYLDINSIISKRKNIIINRKSDINTFLNYIKDFKVDCYNYKFYPLNEVS